MAITIQFDPQHCVQQPTLVLATRWGRKLGQLNTVQNFQMTDNLNTASELSFDLYKYYNPALPGENQSAEVMCELWDEVVDFKLLWCKQWDKWFSLAVTVDDQDATIKNVVGTSLAEAQLGQIMLYNIEINTETDILRDDYTLPTILYDPNDPSRSLLNRIMQKAPHYYIKHVDSWLTGIQRTFTFDGISLYDAFQQIAEEIGCLFVFESCSDADDNIDRSVAVYDLQSYCPECGNRGDFIDVCPQCGNTNIDKGYGEDTTIFISTDVLASEVTYQTNVDAVKNCFRLEAGDDLMTATIINANSNGSAYIWYITDAMKADMPDELVEKINSYNELYNEYQTTKEIDVSGSILNEYNTLVSKYYSSDPEELANKTITSPIIGYPNLSEKLYEILDFYYYIKSELMPTPSTSSTTAAQQAAKLTAANLSPVAVADVSNISLTTANSAVLAMAKVLVSPSYQVKVNESSLTSQTWTGNFTVYSYYDDEDTATSNVISIELNDDFEAYIEQIVEKALGNSNTDVVSATDLFALDLDDFTAALSGYCLDQLTSLNDICQTCMDLLIEQGIADRQAYAGAQPNLYQTVYYPYYERKQALQAALVQRQDELYIIESMQDHLEEVRADIQQILDFQAYLGTDLWLIFCAYRREDTYSNANYISDGLNNAQLFSQALQFIEVASEQLYKSATLQHSITATLWNLLSIPGFEPLIDHFSVGNWLRIRVDEQVYRLRMVGYEIDWNTVESINITFSDVTESMTGLSDAQSVLSQASSMASSYGSVSHQASNGDSGYQVIAGWSLAGLDVTNTKIIAAADGQTQTWDEHGFLLRRYDSITDKYDDEQMKIVNSTIAITDDGWKTVRTAIGRFYYQDPTTGQMKQAYGVNGQVLVGSLILGESLGIYTADGSMTFDENGLTIDTSSGNAFTIKNGDNVQFYIDSDGNVVLDNGAKLMWGNIDLADLILSSDQVTYTDDDGTVYELDKYINAQYAYIVNLTAEMIDAVYGQFEELVTQYLYANEAWIKNLITETISTSYIQAAIADVGYLTADSAEILELQAAAANIGVLTADVANIRDLLSITISAEGAQIINLTSDNVVIDQAVIAQAITGTLLADLIDAEYINTDIITIRSDDGGIYIIGNQMQFTNGQIQFYDDEGNIRLQIGQDADGNFTFELYAADGSGVMIDENGIHESAVTDGLIVDRMVADDASISGYKLNIEEICTIINDTGNSYTIEAASVTINGESLDAWYTTITQEIEGLQDLTQDGLSGIVAYYCYWSSATEAPPDDEDLTPAICGEAICGLTICGLTDGSLWGTTPLSATSGVYRWRRLLGYYNDGHTEWSSPYCLDDGYNRELTTTMQTELSVVQGEIDAKIWESDILEITDSIYGEINSIVDQFAELDITLDGITERVGKVETDVIEASSAAGLAQSIAEDAQTKAEEAIENAANAQSDVDDAKKELEQAQQDYQDLLNRADATDEELSEAQKRIEDAETAVKSAEDAASAAQEAAEKAQAEAEEAAAKAAEVEEALGDISVEVVAMSEQITTLETGVDYIYGQITDVQSVLATFGDDLESIYEELANLDGLKNMTPYFCLWGSGTDKPPDDDKITPAICGEATCGLTICGLTDGTFWTTEEPEAVDGLYRWIKWLLEFENGDVEWSTAYCLDDTYTRTQISATAERYAEIVVTLDSIWAEIGDVQSFATENYTYLSEQISSLVVTTDGIYGTVSNLEVQVSNNEKAIEAVQEVAETAQNTADAAQSAANDAQSAADAAQSYAESVEIVAKAAEARAEATEQTAQDAADAAKAAQDAADAATKEYEELKDRADATDEELAEAQKKMEEAQEAADQAAADAVSAAEEAQKAREEANAAQDTADAAQKAADAAQATADEAQDAADKAQKAAEAAQDAADKAQEDVDALDLTVTEVSKTVTILESTVEGIEASISHYDELLVTMGDNIASIEKELSELDGLTNMTPYFCLWGSGTEAPPDDEDLTPAICGEATCGLTICGVTDGSFWSTEEPDDTTNGLYKWIKWYLEFDNEEENRWSTPYCLTDEYARTLLAAVSNQYASLTVTLDGITAEVGDVRSIMTENYYELSEQISVLEITAQGITSTVSDLEIEVNKQIETIEKEIAAIDGLKSFTPYFCLWYSATVTPPDDEDLTAAICGTAICGTTVCGVTTGGFWTTKEPTAGDGQFKWIKYWLEFEDGSTAWSTAYCLTDEYNRTQISLCYSRIEQLADSITMTVTDLTNHVNSQIQELADSIDLTVSDIYGNIADLQIGLIETQEDIISYINASADTITLTGNRISIQSDYFTLAEDGYITAIGGTIAGWTIFGNGIYSASAASSELVVLSPEFISLGSTSVLLDIYGKVEEDGAKFKVDKYGNLYSVAGTIGGWMISESSLYNSCTSMTDTTTGIYLGTDGLRCYSSSNDQYVNIEKGILTSNAIYAKGNGIYLYNGDDRRGWINSLGDEVTVYSNGSLWLAANDVSIGSSSTSNSITLLSTVTSQGNITVDTLSSSNSSRVYVQADIYSSGQEINYKMSLSATGTDITPAGSLGLYNWTSGTAGWMCRYYPGSSDAEEAYRFGNATTGGGLPTEIYGNGVYLNGSSTAVTSDRVLKDDIVTLTTKYDDLIEKLKPRSYTLKAGGDEKHVGFIADEVETAMKEAGLDPDDYGITDHFLHDGEMLGAIRYDEIIPILVYEIQLLRERVKSLEG